MDVLVLIDKLDDVVHNAKAVPLTDQVRIDREEIYEILDQMRATIPEEIKQARWIVKERQEMLAEAKRARPASRWRTGPTRSSRRSRSTSTSSWARSSGVGSGCTSGRRRPWSPALPPPRTPTATSRTRPAW